MPEEGRRFAVITAMENQIYRPFADFHAEFRLRNELH
jgi:hypothetical protein